MGKSAGGCQYGIAPFIQKKIDEKVSIIYPELKQYLNCKNNHGIKIDLKESSFAKLIFVLN